MISIIIPNYNGERFLPACLNSIFSQDYSDFEVILVDNASSDRSVSLIQSRYPMVTIIKNCENRGYAGGANDGILHGVSGDYILFLNTDTILSRDFLNVMHSSTVEKPEYGMYAPKILYPDGSLQAAGCSASFSGSSWERGKGEANEGHYDRSCEVFGPYGAAALYSRELIEKTRGFDDDFFMYVEETDLAFRARLAGYRCWYECKALVTHYHGGTTGRSSDTALYYLHRNTLWYVLKSYPFSLLLFALPFIVGRNVLAVLYYLFYGKGTIVFRAKMDAIRGLPSLIHKRRDVYRTAEKVGYYLRLFHFS